MRHSTGLSACEDEALIKFLCTINFYSVFHVYLVYDYIIDIYAAWGGLMSAELINEVDVFFRRLKRFGYLSHYITVTELMDNLITKFFIRLAILGTQFTIYSDLLDRVLI